MNIGDLEKVDSDQVESGILFMYNQFDKEFVWRDARSGEVFVFDILGEWNQDALENELLV